MEQNFDGGMQLCCRKLHITCVLSSTGKRAMNVESKKSIEGSVTNIGSSGSVSQLLLHLQLCFSFVDCLLYLYKCSISSRFIFHWRNRRAYPVSLLCQPISEQMPGKGVHTCTSGMTQRQTQSVFIFQQIPYREFGVVTQKI